VAHRFSVSQAGNSAMLPLAGRTPLKSGRKFATRYSSNTVFTHQYRRWFDDQFGIFYSRQQEPDSKQVEFYGHMLIRTFRSKTQAALRAIQNRI
jgi:hypothetical protein